MLKRQRTKHFLGDAKLIAYILNICITFQKLYKQVTQQNIQVTTGAQGTNSPVAKSQGCSQSQLGISCSDRGPIILTFQESLLLFKKTWQEWPYLSLDSLEKIGFGGSGARACSLTGKTIIQFLNPYGHNSECTDGQEKSVCLFVLMCLRKWVILAS